MKLKSLILGSIAAVGLSTAGFAADLGVLTSLDVCDELGLSGLTISSDTNCLQISGKVTYEFNWGNYNGKSPIAVTQFGTRNIDAPDSFAGNAAVDGVFVDAVTGATYVGPAKLAPADVQLVAPVAAAAPDANRTGDWGSKVESWLKFVGTASSDFGPASVTIVLRQRDYIKAANGVEGVDGDAHALRAQEAWVSVGDTTVLAAGKKGSIFNDGDDEPFNKFGLFISDAVDAGVSKGAPKTGGHVIQLWSNVGEGLIAKIGLEALDRTDNAAGTLVGVLDYAGSGITAHISGAVGGLLDGGAQNAGDTYAVHTGFTGTFDQFKLRAALGAGGAYVAGGNSSYWNGLITGEANLDMFKVALSAEASGGNPGAGGANRPTDFGFGGHVGATVSDGIEINIGGKYFNPGAAGVADGYHVAAQLVAALTETVKLTAEIGVQGHAADDAAVVLVGARPAVSDFYGKGELAWAPGGGFTSSVGATVQQNGAYKVTFKAAKSFE